MGSNALLSSSPSLIWLSWGFCLAWAVTIMSKNHLKIHRESVHLGLIYPCQKCDHKAKTENDLKVHDKSVHRGIKYQCNEYDS